MTQIAPELKLTNEPDNIKGIMLSEPTKVSDIVIQANWDLEKIKSNFILIAQYSNKDGKKLSVRFNKPTFNSPRLTAFLGRRLGDKNSNFICNHVGFLFTFPTNITLNEINISIERFDNDSERESYLIRTLGSGDLALNADLL